MEIVSRKNRSPKPIKTNMKDDPLSLTRQEAQQDPLGLTKSESGDPLGLTGKVEDQSKGFWDNLRVKDLHNINRLIREEGLLGNLYDITVGNFVGWTERDRAFKEQRKQEFITQSLRPFMDQIAILEAQGKTETLEYEAAWKKYNEERALIESYSKPGEFSMSGLWTAMKDDPGRFAAEFVNALVADPELALTPIGWSKSAAIATVKLAKYGKTIQKIGSTTAGATGAGTVGGTLVGSISAAKQLKEKGYIDIGQLRDETIVGTAGSVLFAGIFRGLTKAFRRVPQEEVAKAVDKVIKEKVADVIKTGKASIEDIIGSVRKELGIRTPHSDGEIKANIGREFIDMTVPKTKPKAAPKEKLPFGGKKKQAGYISNKAAIALGIPATAMLIGGAIDGKEGAAAMGILSVAGLVGGRVLIRATRHIRKGLEKSSREPIRVDRLVDQWEGEISVGQLRTYQLMQKIRELVPEIKRREQITHWLEGEKSIKLSPKELEVATTVRNVLDELHAFLKKEGLIESFLENYVPHFWRQGLKPKAALLKALLGERKSGPGMSVKTKHSKQRIFETHKEGIDAGYKPLTLDIGDILKMYTDDVYRVVMNKRLVNALKKEIDMEGNKLLMPSGKAPKDYITIDHPSLRQKVFYKADDGTRGYHETFMKAHPDIAEHLKFVFHNTDPGIVKRALLALNFASKRSLVGLSFFHANALIESMLFANVRLKDPRTWVEPLLAVVDTATSMVPRVGDKIPKISKTFKMADMLASGKANDIIEIALKAGLKIGTIEDVGLKYAYGFFNAIGEGLVSLTPKPGKGVTQKMVDVVGNVTKRFDEVMWDKIMTGGKLSVFMREYEKAIAKNARLYKKNPKKYPLVDEDVLANEISEYVNDAFGGLNWRRMAQSAKTHIGREVLNDIYSPRGRQGLQLAFFAPDWTIANFRVLLRGIIPGYARNWRQQKLHVWYATRSTMFYLLGGSLVNMYFTGKPLWENDDMSRVDMGDGRTMQFSKQFVEPFHWASDPLKTGANKLGIIPRTAIELMTNRRWVSPYGAPPIWKEDDPKSIRAGKMAMHLTLGKFVPISAQQTVQQGVAGISGFFGHPVYGKVKESKYKLRKRRKRRPLIKPL